MLLPIWLLSIIMMIVSMLSLMITIATSGNRFLQNNYQTRSNSNFQRQIDFINSLIVFRTEACPKEELTYVFTMKYMHKNVALVLHVFDALVVYEILHATMQNEGAPAWLQTSSATRSPFSGTVQLFAPSNNMRCSVLRSAIAD